MEVKPRPSTRVLRSGGLGAVGSGDSEIELWDFQSDRRLRVTRETRWRSDALDLRLPIQFCD